MSNYAIEVRDEAYIFEDLLGALEKYSKVRTVEPRIKLHKINEHGENGLFFGVVKWINTKKSFGFLACEDFMPHDIFIHSVLLSRVGVDVLHRGQAVYFNPFSAEGSIDKCKVAYINLPKNMPWWEKSFEEKIECVQAPNSETATQYADFLNGDESINSQQCYQIHNPYEKGRLFHIPTQCFIVLTNGGKDFEFTQDENRATIFQDEPYKLALNRIILSYGNIPNLNDKTCLKYINNLSLLSIKI